jgi:hypothetical protein
LKGILLIRFTKSPGAFIDLQYPNDLSEKLEIEIDDVMNIYSVHRMRRTDPNYLQMKFKKLRIASFYTGFNEDDFVGGTDVVLTVLVDDDDTLPKEFEGMLRRMAFEILPKSKESSFYDLLVESYGLLEKGQLEPYWYEQVEGVEVQIQESVATSEFVELSMDEVKFDDYFDIPESERFKAKIRKLRNIIIKQQEIISKLQTTIDEKLSGGDDKLSSIFDLKDEIDDQNEFITELKEKIGILKEKNRNLQKKLDAGDQEKETLSKLGKLVRE